MPDESSKHAKLLDCVDIFFSCSVSLVVDLWFRSVGVVGLLVGRGDQRALTVLAHVLIYQPYLPTYFHFLTYLRYLSMFRNHPSSLFLLRFHASLVFELVRSNHAPAGSALSDGPFA